VGSHGRCRRNAAAAARHGSVNEHRFEQVDPEGDRWVTIAEAGPDGNLRWVDSWQVAPPAGSAQRFPAR
jgi:hypothetical protein